MANPYTERIRNLCNAIQTFEIHVTRDMPPSHTMTAEMTEELETIVGTLAKLEADMKGIVKKKGRGRPKKIVDINATPTGATAATSSTLQSSTGRKKPELTEEQRKAIGLRLKAGKAAAKAKKEAEAAAAGGGGGDSACDTTIGAVTSSDTEHTDNLDESFSEEAVATAATPALSALLTVVKTNAKAKTKANAKTKTKTK